VVVVFIEQTSPTPLVLIIEDDVAIGEVMRTVLIEEGFRVVMSRHALGVREVARLRPDLLVLNLMVGPRAAGCDLLQTMAAADGTARIPVVVCTAHERLVPKDEAGRPTGEVAMVRKPFALEDLLHAVTTALKERPFG
jgi:DNA-binding response OmpR family regulator